MILNLIDGKNNSVIPFLTSKYIRNLYDPSYLEYNGDFYLINYKGGDVLDLNKSSTYEDRLYDYKKFPIEELKDDEKDLLIPVVMYNISYEDIDNLKNEIVKELFSDNISGKDFNAVLIKFDKLKNSDLKSLKPTNQNEAIILNMLKGIFLYDYMNIMKPVLDEIVNIHQKIDNLDKNSPNKDTQPIINKEEEKTNLLNDLNDLMSIRKSANKSYGEVFKNTDKVGLGPTFHFKNDESGGTPPTIEELYKTDSALVKNSEFDLNLFGDDSFTTKEVTYQNPTSDPTLFEISSELKDTVKNISTTLETTNINKNGLSNNNIKFLKDYFQYLDKSFKLENEYRSDFENINVNNKVSLNRIENQFNNKINKLLSDQINKQKAIILYNKGKNDIYSCKELNEQIKNNLKSYIDKYESLIDCLKDDKCVSKDLNGECSIKYVPTTKTIQIPVEKLVDVEKDIDVKKIYSYEEPKEILETKYKVKNEKEKIKQQELVKVYEDIEIPTYRIEMECDTNLQTDEKVLPQTIPELKKPPVIPPPPPPPPPSWFESSKTIIPAPTNYSKTVLNDNNQNIPITPNIDKYINNDNNFLERKVNLIGPQIPEFDISTETPNLNDYDNQEFEKVEEKIEDDKKDLEGVKSKIKFFDSLNKGELDNFEHTKFNSRLKKNKKIEDIINKFENETLDDSLFKKYEQKNFGLKRVNPTLESINEYENKYRKDRIDTEIKNIKNGVKTSLTDLEALFKDKNEYYKVLKDNNIRPEEITSSSEANFGDSLTTLFPD